MPTRKKGIQFLLGSLRTGSFPCHNCINCPLMYKGVSFKHPHTGEEFRLKHYMTCTTDWVVYVMWCPCKFLYVVQTKNEFKTRLNQHRYTIRKKRIYRSLNIILMQGTQNEICDSCYWNTSHYPQEGEID